MQLSQKIILFLVISVSAAFLSLPLIRSGLLYNYGYGYWGPNGHDAIWHLSLINNIKNPFSIDHPSFYPEKLTNYHPLFDIFINLLVRITRLDSQIIYFQIFPIIASLLICSLSFILGYGSKNKFNTGLLLVFFNVFLGSFGWIITLVRGQGFGGESIFWSMQSASIMFNPPLILSLIFILITLIIITIPRYRYPKYFWIIAILAALTPITKSYGGVAIYLLLFFYLLRRKYPPLQFVVSLVIAFSLFFFYNPGFSSSGLFEIKPFWFIHAMFSSTDRLYIPIVASFINTTLQSYRLFDPRFLMIEFAGLLTFLIGNFAYRILIFSKPKQLIKVHFPIFSSIMILIIIPLIFIQKGTPWNTIQFLYYALFLSNIILATIISNIKSPLLSYSISFAIIFTSILGNLDVYKGFLGNPSPSALPPAEISSLSYLRTLGGQVVLTYPFNPYWRQLFKQTPLPLFAYETTAYVSAFSHKRTFLEDEMNLGISGYSYQPRRQAVDRFFTNKPEEVFQNRGFLVQNSIDYIYIANSSIQEYSPDTNALGLNKVYDQDQTVIYQVKR